MGNPIKVIITDDHPIVRSGIRQFVEQAIDIQVVGEAATAKETFQLVEELSPDVLVLDMQLPDMDGLEVFQQLRQKGSPVKVLVLSGHNDPHFVQELLEDGVMGYLLKDEAPQAIVEAVRGVARGEHGWVSRSIAAQMVSWMRGEGKDKTNLTHRELEVLRLVVEGKTNQQISTLLKISEKTVEKYTGVIFQKLGVTSRTEAAVHAVRERLV